MLCILERLLTPSCGVFSVCDFIRHLLQERPTRRMSLTNAMHHDWLRQHFPFHGVTETVDTHMAVEPAPLPPIAEEGPSNTRSPRPKRLQRRALVEEEEEEELPAEMIAYATARDGNPGAATKGLNKRVRGELTPLQEEDAPEGSGAGPRRSSRRTSKAARRD